ncbi:DUF2062 domain-containing protein [archaeon]|jgi:uncharacterized protein|nr:DUF2062 domain-containing protein [archaeon]MBT6761755.1 DUF2062 domain-containing protein [archaeon]
MSFKEKFANVKQQIKAKGFFQSVKEAVVLSHHEPHEIAAGFAVGMMLSFFPSFGVGMIISLFLAWKRGWNFLSTYLGTMLMNPFSASFWYLLEYRIGRMIVGNGVSFVQNVSQWDILPVAKQVYSGAAVLALVLGPIVYFLLYGISTKYRELKEKGKIQMPQMLHLPKVMKKD